MAIDPISLGLMGIGAVSKGVGAVDSYFQQRRAQRQLDALGRQALPQYAVNPAVARLYSGALGEVARPEGYTGAERAAFQQNLARGLNTQAYNARSMGGGSMSRAISGALSGSQLGQYNQFAAQDAALARQNRNAAYSRLIGATNTMQNIANQNTGVALNRRLRQEELLGQAIASQRAYRTNALNSLGSDLTTAGTYGLMSGGFGDTDTDTDTGKDTKGGFLFGELPFGELPFGKKETKTVGLPKNYTLGDIGRKDVANLRNKNRVLGAYNTRGK